MRTQGTLYGIQAMKDPEALAKAKAELEAQNKPVTDKAIAQQAYNNAMQQYGTGGTYQQAAQAITAVLQGLAGGDIGQALAGAANPYVAGMIKSQTAGNDTANVLAHAIWGALSAELAGNSGVAGGAGAAVGELAAKAITQALYPGRKIDDLTEGEKQTISALSMLTAGLAGGLSSGSTTGAATGAQAGKNAAENNFFLLRLLSSPPPVAGQTPQSEADAAIALKLEQAVDEFGKGVVEQCLSGGDCPTAAYIMLQAISAMMNSNAESNPNLGSGLTEEEKLELGGTGSGTPGGWGPEDEENARNKEQQSITVDDLTSTSSKGNETTGRSKLFERTGGSSAANKEFDALSPTDIKDIPGGRVGKLPDGRTVIVRERSTDGRPTLEIQSGKNRIKFRYDE